MNTDSADSGLDKSKFDLRVLCYKILNFFWFPYISWNLGRFGPIPVRSGRFGQGRFGPISGVCRFGPTEVGRFGPVSKLGRFGPIRGVSRFGSNEAKTKYMCGSGRPTVPNFDARP